MARRRRGTTLDEVLEDLDSLFNAVKDIEPADAESKRLKSYALTRIAAIEDKLLN